MKVAYGLVRLLFLAILIGCNNKQEQEDDVTSLLYREDLTMSAVAFLSHFYE